MNAALRSVFAACGIVIGCMGVYGGINLRDRVDLADHNLTASNGNSVLSTWVSSRDNAAVNVSAADYYGQMVNLLKQYYVEPIKNDEVLATGSVRGMIASLGDARSLFMDSKQFRAYTDRQKGIYQGIGVDLALEAAPQKGSKGNGKLDVDPSEKHPDEEVIGFPRVPRLIVVAVVPGGPADQAGVKVGDRVSEIDGHWVVDEGLLDKFKDEQKLFNQKKITYSQIQPLQKELRGKTERALLPLRAEDKLVLGLSGSVSVVWDRSGTERKTKLNKRTSQMLGYGMVGDTIHLPLTQDAVSQMAKDVKGRSAVTLDLRNEPEGDFDAALKALTTLAPTGTYGEFVSDRKEIPQPLDVAKGNPNPPKITLLVDRSTRGPAEVLALALSSRGRAVLKGTSMGGDLAVRQTVALPDGTGYTLVTSNYQAFSSKPTLMADATGERR